MGLSLERTDWISDFVANASFAEGKLLGFEMKPLHQNLTVEQFERFLEEIERSVSLGPEGGPIMLPNKTMVFGVCRDNTGTYCTP